MDDREADNALIDELIELGLDLGRAREVRFHFVYDVQSGADTLSARLSQADFECEVTEDKPNLFMRMFKKSQWLVIATKVMCVDCFIIAELRSYFVNLMENNIGIYDGWEVEVFPEEQDSL